MSPQISSRVAPQVSGLKTFVVRKSAGAKRRLKGSLSAQDGSAWQLRERVAQLEDEVKECRRLHQRVAELTDIVQELLIPMAEQDTARVRELLAAYADAL